MRRNLAAAAICAAAACAVPTCALADPTLPTIGSTIFNVSTYGAVGDGTTNDTAAIQNAINAAAANPGGGIVEIPAAASAYLSGELTLASNVNLQLDTGATLQNSSPLSTFMTTSGSTSNVEISGGGIINDNATTNTSSFHMLDLENVTNLEVTGVTIANSSQEHLVTTNDSNVTINHVTINDAGTLAANGGAYLSNTDGIDYSGANILIENSTISDGDDDIVAKPGPVATSNVTISNDTALAGHGISVGGQTSAGLNGLTVNNCTLSGTTIGIHLKAGRTNGGLVQNCTFSNITMTDVATPFDVSSYYVAGGDHTGIIETQHTPPAVPLAAAAPVLADAPQTFVAGTAQTGGTPQWQNLTFSNININGTASSANVFYGVPDGPSAQISGLVLNNINYQNQPANGLGFVNVADTNITGTFNAPIQAAVMGNLNISGPVLANTPTLTQTASPTLLTAAQLIQTEGQAGSLYNYNSNFDPNSVNTVSLQNLTLGADDNTSGDYNLNSGTLNVAGTEIIGNAGGGNFIQTGGTNNCQIMYINNFDTVDSFGDYIISGGTLNASVGISVIGSLYINNASVNTNLLVISGVNEAGLIDVGSGGVLTAIGNMGIGTLETLKLEGNSIFNLPYGSITGTGTVDLSGTPTITAGDIEVPITADANTSLIKTGDGSLTIGGTQNWGAGSRMLLGGGATNIRTSPGSNVAIEVANSNLNFQFSGHQAAFAVGSLEISQGGVVTVDPSNGDPSHRITVNASHLTIANDPGTLNLNDGALIIEDPDNNDHGASDMAALASSAALGYAGGWNGYGLMSSTAAADPHHAMGVGILNNDNGRGGIYSTFAGQPVDAAAIMATAAYYGDGELLGAVDIQHDFSDYMKGLTGQEPATWQYGDYTYAGTVDVNTDFRLFALGYYSDGGDLSALSAAVADSDMTPDQQALAQQIIIATVPEPSSATLLAGACVFAARRRRRPTTQK